MRNIIFILGMVLLSGVATAQGSNYGKPGYPGGSWGESLPKNETVIPKQFQDRIEPEVVAPAEDSTPPEETVEPEPAPDPEETVEPEPAPEPQAPVTPEEPVQPAAAKVHVTIDKSTQEMSVSVDGIEQYRWPVSTGKRGYETPAGSYTATSMNKMWYSKQWDNAPMPHSVFFMKDGHAIHGTKEVKNLGKPASHGCVRLAPENAKELFKLVEANGLENTEVQVVGQEAYSEEVAEQPSYDNQQPQPQYGQQFPPPPPRWIPRWAPPPYRGFFGGARVNVPGFNMELRFDRRSHRKERRWRRQRGW